MLLEYLGVEVGRPAVVAAVMTVLDEVHRALRATDTGRAPHD